MSDTVTDTIKTNGGEIIFLWHPGKTVDNLKSFQIYDFCVNDDGKVCLVKDKEEKRFTLPGRHVDAGVD